MVRGCTESLAFVKSAMSFRGPPWSRCCRWYFFSSDRGRKRFIILWYWTSTWERGRERHKQNQHMLKYQELHSLIPEFVYHAPLGVVCFTAGIKMDIFLIKLSVVHVRLLHNLEKRKYSRTSRPGCSFTSSAGQESDLLAWVLLYLAPCSCCDKRTPTARLSSAS